MSEVTTYNTPFGAVSVVAGTTKRTRYNGRKCQTVVTRGNHDAFFLHDDGTSDVEILHTHTYPNGDRKTWYVPTYLEKIIAIWGDQWDEEESTTL
jgi:hypothetical protein